VLVAVPLATLLARAGRHRQHLLVADPRLDERAGIRFALRDVDRAGIRLQHGVDVPEAVLAALRRDEVLLREGPSLPACRPTLPRVREEHAGQLAAGIRKERRTGGDAEPLQSRPA